MAALSTSLDHPSPVSHCLNIALFSPVLFPAHQFCCTAPPPMHPSLYPCPRCFLVPPPPQSSYSSPGSLAIPLLSQLWMPPPFQHIESSPQFFSFCSYHSWKTNFDSLPISLIHLSSPCPTASLGLSWQLKSVFQLIFYIHFFLISLSVHDPSPSCPLLLFPFPFFLVCMWQSTLLPHP